jgi:hypothetical protein
MGRSSAAPGRDRFGRDLPVRRAGAPFLVWLSLLGATRSPPSPRLAPPARGSGGRGPARLARDPGPVRARSGPGSSVPAVRAGDLGRPDRSDHTRSCLGTCAGGRAWLHRRRSYRVRGTQGQGRDGEHGGRRRRRCPGRRPRRRGGRVPHGFSHRQPSQRRLKRSTAEPDVFVRHVEHRSSRTGAGGPDQAGLPSWSWNSYGLSWTGPSERSEHPPLAGLAGLNRSSRWSGCSSPCSSPCAS